MRKFTYSLLLMCGLLLCAYAQEASGQAAPGGGAQASTDDNLARGVVIEKVACLNDASQSYALYLPSSYTPSKRWPVLYLFDAFARGKISVEAFRQAAEAHGFILVGSNNSQNNLSSAKIGEIITAFWKDTHARLSLDDGRAYAAGLSGGARVATYFAASCRGCLAGVIVSGATFPAKYPLDKTLPYAVYGTAGVDDFNYPELVTTFAKLRKTGTPSELEIFEGRHGWPPPEVASDALAWLNLQAMKTGRMPPDQKLIADSLSSRLNRAQALAQRNDENDVVAAARVYEAILADYPNGSETKGAAENLAALRRRKSYQKALDEEKDSFDKQQRTARRIMDMSAELLDASGAGAALRRISDEAGVWRQRAQAPADSAERRLARRILDQVFIETYETALYVNERQKDYRMMIANLEVRRAVSPQNSSALLELARAFALGKRKREALDTLREAVSNGFHDCARINQAEWQSLRDEQGFRDIIKRLNCTVEGT